MTDPEKVDETGEEIDLNALREEVGQRRGEWWIVTWTYRPQGPRSAWEIKNTRVAGCVGMWWAHWVLSRGAADDYRIMGAIPLCQPAYEALAGVMPAGEGEQHG